MTKIRKMVVGLTAVAAFSSVGVQPASATLTRCGTLVTNYGVTSIQACHDQIDSDTYEPVAFFDAWNTVQSYWTACTVNVMLFVDNVKARHEQFSCLGIAQSDGYGAFPGQSFDVQYDKCYRAVASWTGTYQGNTVGSNPNAESLLVCWTP